MWAGKIGWTDKTCVRLFLVCLGVVPVGEPSNLFFCLEVWASTCGLVGRVGILSRPVGKLVARVGVPLREPATRIGILLSRPPSWFRRECKLAVPPVGELLTRAWVPLCGPATQTWTLLLSGGTFFRRNRLTTWLCQNCPPWVSLCHVIPAPRDEICQFCMYQTVGLSDPEEKLDWDSVTDCQWDGPIGQALPVYQPDVRIAPDGFKYVLCKKWTTIHSLW